MKTSNLLFRFKCFPTTLFLPYSHSFTNFYYSDLRVHINSRSHFRCAHHLHGTCVVCWCLWSIAALSFRFRSAQTFTKRCFAIDIMTSSGSSAVSRLGASAFSTSSSSRSTSTLYIATSCGSTATRATTTPTRAVAAQAADIPLERWRGKRRISRALVATDSCSTPFGTSPTSPFPMAASSSLSSHVQRMHSDA